MGGLNISGIITLATGDIPLPAGNPIGIVNAAGSRVEDFWEREFV